MTATQAAPAPTRRWVVAMATVPAVALGLVATAVLVLLLDLLGLLVGVLVTAALAAWAWSRASRDPVPRVLGQLDARPADPEAQARLVNLVEGLSLSGGVTPPQLHVVDSDARNLLVLGLDERGSHLVVTRGLLDALERIELEAVLARALVQIRRGDLPTATTAVEVLTTGEGAAAPMLARPVARLVHARLAPGGRAGDDVVLDREGAGLTRYPPGLIAALRALQHGSTVVPGANPATRSLWLADPFPPDRRGGSSHTPLADRIEALELL